MSSEKAGPSFNKNKDGESSSSTDDEDRRQVSDLRQGIMKKPRNKSEERVETTTDLTEETPTRKKQLDSKRKGTVKERKKSDETSRTIILEEALTSDEGSRKFKHPSDMEDWFKKIYGSKMPEIPSFVYSLKEKPQEKNMRMSASVSFTPQTLEEDNMRHPQDFERTPSLFSEFEEVFETKFIPPDGGWGWWVVAAAFIMFFIIDGTLFAFGIFLEGMAETFGCHKSEIANANAIKTAVMCFQGPVAAALVNRYGFRLVAFIGSLIGMLSYIGTGLSPNLYVALIATGVIGGIGFGMIYIAALIAVGFYFEKYRSFATGLAVCGSGVGTMVLAPALKAMQDILGWRNTFYVLAAVTFLCLPVTLLFRPLHTVTVEVDVHLSQDTIGSMKSSIVSRFSGSVRSDKFFDKYHNKQYPTISGLKSESMIDVIQPSIQSKNFNDNENNSQRISSKVMFPENEAVTIQEMSIDTDEESQITCCNKLRKYCWKCRYCCFVCICCLCFNKSGRSFNRGNVLLRASPCCKYLRRKRKISYTRPMYRDDILSDKVYFEKADSKSDYCLEVTRVMTEEDLKEELQCKLFPESVKRVLATMLDFRLMGNIPFSMIVFYQMCLSMGYYVPYMFLLDRGVAKGISKDKLIWLISTIGATNTIGRIGCGVIVSWKLLSALPLTYISLLLGGVATLLSGLSYALWYQYVFAGVFGLAIACSSTLRTALIVEVVGLENLTNGTGVSFLFRGIGDLLGIVIAGQFIDWTGAYEVSFYFAGIFVFLSGVIIVLAQILNDRSRKKRSKPKK